MSFACIAAGYLVVIALSYNTVGGSLAQFASGMGSALILLVALTVINISLALAAWHIPRMQPSSRSFLIGLVFVFAIAYGVVTILNGWRLLHSDAYSVHGVMGSVVGLLLGIGYGLCGVLLLKGSRAL